MEEFLLLKSSLEKQINDIDERIHEILEKEEDYKSEKEIIDKLYNEETKDFSNKRKRELVRLYPSLGALFGVYSKLNNYFELLDNSEYEQIDSKELSEVLKIACSPLYNIGQYIKDLEYCKKLFPVISEYSFDDKAVKKNVESVCLSLETRLKDIIKSFVSAIISTIKKEFNNKYFGLKEEIESIEDLKEQMEELKKLNIFDNSGNIEAFFEDKEALKKFYEWLMNSFDIPTQLKIIPLITKQGLLNNVKEKESEISQNRELVLQELQDKFSKEELFDLDSLDLSSYSEEEKQIVIEGINIYKELAKIEKNRDDILLTASDNEIKDQFYLFEDLYRWDIILYDIENNLLPNVSTDKENVLQSFKTIMDIFYRYKEELEKRYMILNELLGEIEQYQELVNFVKKYNVSQYDYIIENGVDKDSSEYPKGIPYEQLLMCYYVNHDIKEEIEKLTKLKEKIEENIRSRKVMIEENDGIDLDMLDCRFDFIYDDGYDKIKVFKEILQGTYVKQEDKPEQLETVDNLVICLCDIEEGKSKEYSDDYKKACELIEHRIPSDLTGKIHKLWKYSSTGKKVEYNIPHVDMKRIRSLGDSRIGLAIFDVSENIMKILREKYNLSEKSMVYGLFNAVTPGANHKTYSRIHRIVGHNMDTIVSLGQLFNSDKPDFEKIFQILDLGIQRRDELIEISKASEVKKND